MRLTHDVGDRRADRVVEEADDAAQDVAEHAAATDVEVEVLQRQIGEVELELARRRVDAGLDVGDDLERRLGGVVEVR